MSELSFEQMLEDSVKTIRNGEIVQGTVIDVKEDEIFAEIRYRMEMEDHPMADCCVKIHACTKGEKSAQMVKAMMERQKKELSEE